MKIDISYKVGQPVGHAVFETPLKLPDFFTSPHGNQLKAESLREGGNRISSSVQGFIEAQYLMDLLTKDILSAIHLHNVFGDVDNIKCPIAMIDTSESAGWHQITTLVAFIIEAFGLHNVSYECENDGHLYIHLFPKVGSDEDSKKSRKNLRGHTDGSVLPLTGQGAFEPLPPGPDIVILIGVQNENQVPTRVHPLSQIVRNMQPDSIRALLEEDFVFEPQSTFDLPEVVSIGQRVIQESEEGFLIRYSHSKVTYRGNQASPQEALQDLQKCIKETSTDIVIKPGDILFINNRTSIHGRAKVSDEDAKGERWLIRTYCQKDDEKRHKTDINKPYSLNTVPSEQE